MDNSSFYPNLKELIQNTSEQTAGISLRIKDSTRSLFELEAKKYHTTISSIINNLLDDYAKRYILEKYRQKTINTQTICRHIETAARKASTLDLETLLRDTMENYQPEALFELNYGVETCIIKKSDGTLQFKTDKSCAASDDQLIRDFAMWATGHPTHFFQQNPPYIFFADGVITALPPHNQAYIQTVTDDAIKVSYLDLYLPAPQWLIVITIISAFLQKSAELNDSYPPLGETACRDIIELANTTRNNAEFAEGVAKIVLLIATAEERNNRSYRRGNGPTWVFIIVRSLEKIGGKGTLNQIYDACRATALEFGKLPTKHFEATIRGELENHSRDSKKFNGQRDYFTNPENGSGFWMLNPGVHADLEKMAILISE